MEKGHEEAHKLTLHKEALDYARNLIEQGKINFSEGTWTQDKPTPADGDAYLTDHNFNQYGKWFLGLADDTNAETKEHYEFPIGNFKEIYRSGVVAAKQRAGQWKHFNIEKAAGELLNLIDAKAEA